MDKKIKIVIIGLIFIGLFSSAFFHSNPNFLNSQGISKDTNSKDIYEIKSPRISAIDDNYEETAHEAAFYSDWYWRFIYHLKRTKEKIKDKILREELEKLEVNIIQNKKIKDLYMPVRWAELLTKNKSES